MYKFIFAKEGACFARGRISRGINVVNLHGGTFDLIVEGERPFVCELKRMAEGKFFGKRK